MHGDDDQGLTRTGVERGAVARRRTADRPRRRPGPDHRRSPGSRTLAGHPGRTSRGAPGAPRHELPYSEIAEFVSIAAYHGRIAALGNVHGGAHGNSRWTVWTGDTSTITEYPQTLETFGGVNGGDLEAVVTNKNGPLITGSYRFGDSGLDGGIWVPDRKPVGSHWAQPDPTGTDLDTTRTTLVSVQAAAADAEHVVLAGSTTHLDSRVHQVASVWVRPDQKRWHRIELPGAGNRSEALSIACWTGTGQTTDCLVAGTSDGRLAAWTVSGSHVARINGLPEVRVVQDGARPAAIGRPGLRAIAYDGDADTGLLYESAGRWLRGVGPHGKPMSGVAQGQQAYVITQAGDRRTLSRTTLPAA
ncbi:hypothetical protein [Microlunatus endophyticus]